jgi:processive 1,2-diacylglycerol beta-glucosyltransferase
MTAMRVMIASLPIGTGHDVAARALAEAMGQAGVEVHFSHHLAGPSRVHTAAYFLSVRYSPWLFSTMFQWGDRTAFAWKRHRIAWRGIGLDLLPHVYEQYRPDWVVATHPFALTAWTALKTRYPRLKVVGVLTDLSAHQFWWEPDADAYAVWLPEERQDLVRFGYPENRIWDTGIPIRSIFHDDALQFARLFDGPIVVLGGGLGIGPYHRILKGLLAFDVPVLAVCGQNERLRWQLSQRSWPPHVTIAGYVENMPEILCASRAVVGKPGGVTAAEVCQVQVPWVLTHWIAGQEEVNRDRLTAHNLAALGDHGLQEALAPLLVESPLREAMLRQQAALARPNASRDIVSRILAFA